MFFLLNVFLKNYIHLTNVMMVIFKNFTNIMMLLFHFNNFLYLDHVPIFLEYLIMNLILITLLQYFPHYPVIMNHEAI